MQVNGFLSQRVVSLLKENYILNNFEEKGFGLSKFLFINIINL